MTASRLGSRRAKLMALALGAVIALSAVATQRVPAGTGQLGLDVELSTTATGELAVLPSGRVLLASGLTPGGRATTGQVTLQNQTSARVGVAPLASGPPGEADGAVRLALDREGRTLAAGSLADLRRAENPVVSLAPGERMLLRLKAGVPATAPPGWQGRIVRAQLGWRVWVDGKVRR